MGHSLYRTARHRARNAVPEKHIPRDPLAQVLYGRDEEGTLTLPTPHADMRVTFGSDQAPEDVMHATPTSAPAPRDAAPTREQIQAQIDELVRRS